MLLDEYPYSCSYCFTQLIPLNMIRHHLAVCPKNLFRQPGVAIDARCDRCYRFYSSLDPANINAHTDCLPALSPVVLPPNFVTSRLPAVTIEDLSSSNDEDTAPPGFFAGAHPPIKKSNQRRRSQEALLRRNERKALVFQRQQAAQRERALQEEAALQRKRALQQQQLMPAQYFPVPPPMRVPVQYFSVPSFIPIALSPYSPVALQPVAPASEALMQCFCGVFIPSVAYGAHVRHAHPDLLAQ